MQRFGREKLAKHGMRRKVDATALWNEAWAAATEIEPRMAKEEETEWYTTKELFRKNLQNALVTGTV